MKISRESIAKQVFGSPLKRKLLEFLSSNQAPVSERELARIIGVSNVAVNKAMKQFLELNIVKAHSIGTAIVWEINKTSFAYPYVQSFIEAGKISPLEYVKRVLHDDITMINKAATGFIYDLKKRKAEKAQIITGAFIFGSVADQTETPESDIDVLIIVDDLVENTEDLIRDLLLEEVGMKILEKTGNKVSFHIYTVKAVEKNEPKWLHRAMNEGIKV